MYYAHPHVYWGIVHERGIAEHYMLLHEESLMYQNATCERNTQSVVHGDWLIGTPDMLIKNKEGVVIAGVEIKTASAYVSDDAFDFSSAHKPPRERMPETYYAQCCGYLMLHPQAKSWTLAVLAAGNMYHEIVVTREEAKDDIVKYITSAHKFYLDHVVTGEPPKEPKTSMHDINDAWPDSLTSSVKAISYYNFASKPDPQDAAICNILREIAVKREELDKLSKDVDVLKTQIANYMQDAERIVDAETQEPLVSYKKQERSTLDVKRLQLEQPTMAKEYLRTSSTRVLRFFKGK
jgi:predicted phage-related endonuclease